MKQISLAATGFELATKRTRKRAFLDEMGQVIPWSDLLVLIAPHAPAGKTGRPPFALEVMLRIHLLQQFFGHSDPAMEEALHDPIENLNGLVATYARNVKRWSDGAMVLRWVASALSDAAPRMRRLRGCDQMITLLQALAQRSPKDPVEASHQAA